MPLNTGLWTTWGTGTQDQSGGTLNQTPPGTSGVYVGVYSNATYDMSNKAAQVQFAQLPSSTAGTQAVLRAEIDAANAVIIGYSDGGLLCQHQIANTITNVSFSAWPAGTIGLRIVFDNAQNLVWFDSYAPATGWVNVFSEAIPIATTALRISIATGCYQAVGSPGTTRWESTGLPIVRNLSGFSDGTSTVNEVISRKRSLTAGSAGVGAASATATARRSLVGSAAGLTTVRVQFGVLKAQADGVAVTIGQTSARRSVPGVVSTGVSTVAGQTTRRRSLVAASPGVATVAVQVTRLRSLTGASVGTSTVTTVFGIPTDLYGTVVYNDPALIGYWRLGEPSGTSARDSKGSHGGTYVGGVTLNQPGALNSGDDTSALFNGSTGYVSIPDFPIVGPAGGFTIECWFRMDTVIASAALVSKRQDVTPYDGQVELEIGGGGVVTFWVNTTTGWHPLTSTRAYAVGVWHHVTAHYQTDSGGMQSLNVNGEGQGLATGIGTVLNNPSGVKLGIGRNFYGGGTYNFNGCIDEVAIYNATAPSIAWVRDHYRKGIASRNPYQAAVERTSGLVAYWPLSEPTRPNVFDEAGNGHTLDMFAGISIGNPSQGIAGTLSGQPYGQGRCLYFNGTLTAKATRSAPDADLNFGAGEFSLEFWSYQDTTSSATAGCIMEWGNGVNWGVHLFNWDTTMPQNLWVNLAPTDATAAGINSGDFMTPAVWHHVVVLRRVNTAYAYIDGVVRGPPADVTGKTLHFDYIFNLGWRPSPAPDGGYNHVGYLDQIAMYNVALTPAQINEHYLKGNGQVYKADLVGAAAGMAVANARAPKLLPFTALTDDFADGVITPDKWLVWASDLSAEQSSRPWGVRV